jgi:hypothetical protein
VSTPEQKEIFTRLHGLFTRANNELAETKVELDRLTTDYAKLNATFIEQNEILKRYENTFGILPPAQPMPTNNGPWGTQGGPWDQPASAPGATAVPMPPWTLGKIKLKASEELHRVFSYDVAEQLFKHIFNK